MNKTPRNPRKLPHNSWGYRLLQLRRALGWKQYKIASVMGVNRWTVTRIESGEVTRPSIDVIRRIKNLESAYEDILKIYKKSPARMDRLKKLKPDDAYGQKRYGGVRLLPIEVRRPEDIETLGKVETGSNDIYFGRATRRKMQQVGMSLRRKEYIARRNKKVSLTMRKKIAEGWRGVHANRKVQPGRPKDEGE